MEVKPQLQLCPEAQGYLGKIAGFTIAAFPADKTNTLS